MDAQPTALPRALADLCAGIRAAGLTARTTDPGELPFSYAAFVGALQAHLNHFAWRQFGGDAAAAIEAAFYDAYDESSPAASSAAQY